MAALFYLSWNFDVLYVLCIQSPVWIVADEPFRQILGNGCYHGNTCLFQHLSISTLVYFNTCLFQHLSISTPAQMGADYLSGYS